MFSAIADYYYDPDETSKAAKKNPLVKETIPFYMKKFEEIAEKNSGYLANSKVSRFHSYPFFFLNYLTSCVNLVLNHKKESHLCCKY